MKVYVVSFAVFNVVLALTFSACESFKPSQEQAKSDVDNIVYQTDKRNGLCFAVVRSNTSSGFEVTAIANVPEKACDR